MSSHRVAVLSDIHGNLHALNAVLDDIKKDDISKIIVAGDSTGPIDQNKVYSKLFEHQAIMIKGNGEKRVVSRSREKIPYRVWWQQSYAGNRWMYENIEPFIKNYLEFLPDQRVVDFSGADPIRVVHGSPHDQYTAQGILPDPETEDSQRLSNVHSTISLEKAVEGVNEKVLICGHTHRPWIRQLDDLLVVNPGSVGNSCSGDPKPDYAVMTWDKDQWTVEPRTVDYDRQAMYDAFIMHSIMTSVKVFAKLTLYCRMTGLDINLEFLSYVKKLAAEEELVYDDAYTAAVNSFNWSKYGDI